MALALILFFITQMKPFTILSPIPELIYNLTVILIMTHKFYRAKVFFYNNKKYLHESILFNPPISIVSMLLLLNIGFEFITMLLNFLLETIPFLDVLIPIAIIIIMLVNMEKSKDKYVKSERDSYRRIGHKK